MRYQIAVFCFDVFVGTHWCWFETVLAWTVGPLFVLNLIVIAVSLWRRL